MRADVSCGGARRHRHGSRAANGLVAAVGLVLASAPDVASAGDSLHPRTPVEWSDVACMEFVDRSVETNYALVYGIPYEDTEVTADEVEQSRTHQFFAICRQTYLHEDLPRWITEDDVEATLQNYEDFEHPGDDDIFELAADWDGCWHRVSEDSERRAITDAMASQPVSWDTATVPPGVYSLLGYTFEPPFNLWSARAGGVVRVYDGGDPAQSGPAAAITNGQQLTCAGATASTTGCVSALPGTTMTALYTVDPGPDPSASPWVPVPMALHVPVEGVQFTLDWDVPAEAAGASTILRIDFTDPNGRTYTAYQYDPVIVLSEESAGCADEPDEPEACEAGRGEDPSCGATQTDSDPGLDGSDTDTDTGVADAVGADGGCRAGGGPPVGGGALGSLFLLALLRPRSSSFRKRAR